MSSGLDMRTQRNLQSLMSAGNNGYSPKRLEHVAGASLKLAAKSAAQLFAKYQKQGGQSEDRRLHSDFQFLRAPQPVATEDMFVPASGDSDHEGAGSTDPTSVPEDEHNQGAEEARLKAKAHIQVAQTGDSEGNGLLSRSASELSGSSIDTAVHLPHVDPFCDTRSDSGDTVVHQGGQPEAHSAAPEPVPEDVLLDVTEEEREFAAHTLVHPSLDPTFRTNFGEEASEGRPVVTSMPLSDDDDWENEPLLDMNALAEQMYPSSSSSQYDQSGDEEASQNTTVGPDHRGTPSPTAKRQVRSPQGMATSSGDPVGTGTSAGRSLHLVLHMQAAQTGDSEGNGLLRRSASGVSESSIGTAVHLPHADPFCDTRSDSGDTVVHQGRQPEAHSTAPEPVDVLLDVTEEERAFAAHTSVHPSLDPTFRTNFGEEASEGRPVVTSMPLDVQKPSRWDAFYAFWMKDPSMVIGKMKQALFIIMSLASATLFPLMSYMVTKAMDRFSPLEQKQISVLQTREERLVMA